MVKLKEKKLKEMRLSKEVKFQASAGECGSRSLANMRIGDGTVYRTWRSRVRQKVLKRKKKTQECKTDSNFCPLVCFTPSVLFLP